MPTAWPPAARRALPHNFDHNAATPVRDGAWRAYLAGLQLEPDGSAAAAAQALARRQVAERLGVATDAVHWVPGGTQAAALALHGALVDGAPGHCVASAIEHPAVVRNLQRLAAEGRCAVTFVAVPRHGRVDVDAVRAALRPDTRLVSVMLANNETGVVQPVADIAALCHRRGIVVHSDAVQAVGKVPVRVPDLGVDLLTFSGHKLGAAGGLAGLYVRAGCAWRWPWTPASTDPGPAAASLAAAITAPAAYDAHLRDQLEAALLELPHSESLGGAQPRLPNTSCMRFAGCPGDALMMALDVRGFAISTGSACSSGSTEPSAALLGMGLTPREALEAVRFSLGPETSDAEVRQLVQAVREVVGAVRAG